MAPFHLIAVSLTLGAQCAHAILSAPILDTMFRVSNEEWAREFATANATTEVPFAGYDITTPYPGTRSADWRLSVQVKEGIPAGENGAVATGTWIRWGAPPSLM